MSVVGRCAAMMMSGGILALGLTAAVPAQALDWINIPSFANTCGTTLVCNGAAAENGAALRLVPAAPERAGAAWAPAAFFSGQGFVSTFTFRLGEGADGWRADGLAFVMAQNPATLGDPARYGGSMGFEGLVGTVAVEFDTFDNGNETGGDNHVAVDRNGVLENAAAASPYGVTGCNAAGSPGCLSNGNVWTAIVAYDAQGKSLSVTVRDGEAIDDTVIAAFPIDLAALLGGSYRMGFSAGTGAGFMAHDLLSWSVMTSPVPGNFTDNQDVPEPAAAALLGIGLAGLGLSRRRR